MQTHKGKYCGRFSCHVLFHSFRVCVARAQHRGTALMGASCRGHTAVVSALLAAKATANAANDVRLILGTLCGCFFALEFTPLICLFVCVDCLIDFFFSSFLSPFWTVGVHAPVGSDLWRPQRGCGSARRGKRERQHYLQG